MAAERTAGNCSPLGVLKADAASARRGRGARAATLSRRRRSCSPRVSKTHSVSAELFLASCRVASCLSHSLRREPPPPPSPVVNAHTSRRRSRGGSGAHAALPAASLLRGRGPGTRARPRGPGRGQEAAPAQPLRARARGGAPAAARVPAAGGRARRSRAASAARATLAKWMAQRTEKWEANPLSLWGPSIPTEPVILQMQ